MKKNGIALLLTAVLVFVSCSKDKDETEPTTLRQITKIECKKNGSLSDGFAAEIYYDQDGIARIVENSITYHYTFVDGVINVSKNSIIETRHHLDRDNKITKTEIRDIDNGNNEEYTKETYSYTYQNKYWIKTSWEYNNSQLTLDQHTWDNGGNVTNYTYRSTEIMEFEYNSQKQPENFPYRILNSFTPVLFENFTPLNFQFGVMNKNLVEKASKYELPKNEDILSEYTFTYNLSGDYITGMTVVEKLIEESVTNVYEYTFEYNYDPK